MTPTPPPPPQTSTVTNCGNCRHWENTSEANLFAFCRANEFTTKKFEECSKHELRTAPAPETPAVPEPRNLMNGKPVFQVPARQVINLESGFKEKKLCDGPTFSTGMACAYSCAFCYVPSIFGRHKDWNRIKAEAPLGRFENVVIRREGALQNITDTLTRKGKPRFDDPEDNRVIFASPLVDVAANMDLVRETAEACNIILNLTNWQIRLLSKSNLLPKVADLIPANHAQRMIYGVSTGTLDDNLAAAFEQGTPKVSKRIQSLHELQNRGLRTFGMICPSLPMPTAEDYGDFARIMSEAIRVEKCEHVWAEVINVRGASMNRTVDALCQAGFVDQGALLFKVSNDIWQWRDYARQTLIAHCDYIPPDKLRFLQYVKPNDPDFAWWKERESQGVIIL